MLLLYDSGVSGNCYKVRLLLAHLGLDYERRELSVVDRSNRAELLGDLNPGLRVPTLVLDDGRALGESGAILNYLAEGTEYIPENLYERARMLQWMFFEQYSHEPYVAVPRFWLTKNVEVDPETLAERQRVGYLAFDAMESHLSGNHYLAAGTLHARRHRPLRLHPRRPRGRLRHERLSGHRRLGRASRVPAEPRHHRRLIQAAGGDDS